MKSPWVWVVGFILLIWFFSEDKKVANSPAAYEPYASESQSEPIQSYSPPATFGGNPCTGDCSGHEAGYNWAEDNGINNPDDCGGNSDSFIEGCQTYAEEQGADSGSPEE